MYIAGYDDLIPLSFIIRTFGCKTNQYESQGIRESLLAAGMHESESTQSAQVLIVNTCTVTGKAGQNCLQEIRRCLKLNPDLRVLVTGCAVDVSEEWLQQADCIEAVFANPRKAEIAAYLVEGTVNALADSPDGGDRFAFRLNQFHGHTRAFLKIQDGCGNYCSYCIIPYARGVPQSRAADDVLEEARRLCEAGYHELVLTGINIGAYNYNGIQLPQLLRQLAATPGLWRLRLGSVEPVYVGAGLLQVIVEHPQICQHLHLPLQSGDDKILSAMNRKYTVGEFLNTVNKCREFLDHPAITTDIICGFPGEDTESFTHTLNTVKNAAFSRIHIFTYSPREGTPAADMPQCDSDLVAAHRKELSTLAGMLAAEYAASLVGHNEKIIIEKPQDGVFSGYTGSYMRVVVDNPPEWLQRGQMVKVDILKSRGAELYGNVSVLF